MLRALWSISSLLSGMSILVVGSGLLGMLVSLRGVNEGFSNFMIGLIMSGYYAGYVAGAWICPILIRRVGHVRCFASFAAIAAILTLSFGMVVNPWVWLVLRAINGLALIGIYMVTESWLNERSQNDPSTQSSVFAVYMAVSLLAVAIGQYMATIYGPDRLESFVLAAVLFCMGLLPIALTPVPQPLPIASPNLSLRRLAVKTPSGAFGALCSGLVAGAFWALTALYGRGLNFTDSEIASFTVAAIMGGAIMQWPIGWLSDHSKDRREVLLAVAAGATLSLAALSILDRLLPGGAVTNDYIWAAFIMGIFQFSLYSLSVAQATDRLPANETLEATRGLLLLHGIGAAIGPVICGMAMQYGGTRAFPQSMGIMTAVLGLFVWYRIHHDDPVPQEDRIPFHPTTEQLTPVAIEMDPRAEAPLADAQLEPEPEPLPTPEEAAAAAAAAVAMAQTVTAEAVETASQAANEAVAAALAVADESAATDESQPADPASPADPHGLDLPEGAPIVPDTLQPAPGSLR